MANPLRPNVGLNTYQADPVNLGARFNRNQLGYETTLNEQVDNARNTRARQDQFAQALQDSMNGQGPSLAQKQYQQAADRAIKQQAGAVASNRSMNPALAGRTAAYGAGDIMANAAQGSAQLREQEKLNAQQQLGQALQAQRGQDIGMAGLSSQGLQSLTGMQNQAALQAQNINANVAAQNAAMTNQANIAELQNVTALVGGGFGAVGSRLTMSEGGEVPDSSRMASDAKKEARELRAEAAKHAALAKALKAEAEDHDRDAKEHAEMGRRAKFAKGGRAKPAKDEDHPELLRREAREYHLLSKSADPKERRYYRNLGVDFDDQADENELRFHRYGLHGPGYARGGQLKTDDPRRDVVPAMLSPGEIVLPRSVSLDEDAPDKAADFVEKIQRREGKTRGFGAVLEARRGLAKGGKVDLSKLTLGKRIRSRVTVDEED